MIENTVRNTEDRKEKTLRVLSTVTNLPTIPIVIFEVTKLIDNPSSSASDLAKIINKDQGLVTKVLAVANSPLYGIPRRVSTIDFAIVILGYNHIKNIVIALSMMDAMKKVGDKKFDQKKYWTHSLMTATAAKRIADDLGFPQSGEAFTAGLLHDLGLPIINKFFTKEFEKIIVLVRDQGKTFEEAEIEELGITHELIGKFLMDKWNLPATLSEVVLNHHHPGQAEKNKSLTSIVHLADYMTHKLMIGDFYWDHTYPISTEIFNILNLGDEEYLDGFIQNYKDLFSEQLNNFSF